MRPAVPLLLLTSLLALACGNGSQVAVKAPPASTDQPVAEVAAAEPAPPEVALPAPQTNTPTDPVEALIAVARALPDSASACEWSPETLRMGGLYTLRCHIQGQRPLHELLALPELKIWASGPHRSNALDLDNASAFGHYDPAFAEWVAENAVPTSDEQVALLRPAYDAALRRHARAAWRVRRVLESQVACRDAEVTAYREAVNKGETQYFNQRYWGLLQSGDWCEQAPPIDEHDIDWENQVDSVLVEAWTGWWLRRHIDGTDRHWAGALHKGLKAYDGEWLKDNAD